MRISDWSSDVCSSDLAHPSVAGRVEQRGFAAGAPHASRHGTAVASLLIGSGAVRGAAPGGRLLAADVYGSDPAGGNASAIARALGWLVQRGAAVTTISLVGRPRFMRSACRMVWTRWKQSSASTLHST